MTALLCRHCRRLSRIIFGIADLFLRDTFRPCPSLNRLPSIPPPRSSPPLVARVAPLTIGFKVAVSRPNGSSRIGWRSSKKAPRGRKEMPEDDGREQDGDPDGDPAFVEVLRVVIMICEVAGCRSRLHGIPRRSSENQTIDRPSLERFRRRSRIGVSICPRLAAS